MPDFQVEFRAWINVSDCKDEDEALTRVALCGHGALLQLRSAKQMKLITQQVEKAIPISEKWRVKKSF